MTLEMLIKDSNRVAAQKAMEEGVEKGIEKGIEQEQRDTVSRMLAAGMSEETIMVATALSTEELHQVVKEISSRAE